MQNSIDKSLKFGETKSMIQRKKKKVVVGWKEKVLFPNWSEVPVIAKVDTGAQTSAIHAEQIKVFRRDGKRFVSFKLFPYAKTKKASQMIEAQLIEKRVVKSSVGTRTERPVVRATVVIGRKKFAMEITLVNRDMMGYRMLLGRNALDGRFLVDCEHAYLCKKPVDID